jgi:hypothetical protein
MSQAEEKKRAWELAGARGDLLSGAGPRCLEIRLGRLLFFLPMAADVT